MHTLRIILLIPSSVEENLTKPKSLATHSITIVAIICASMNKTIQKNMIKNIQILIIVSTYLTKS